MNADVEGVASVLTVVRGGTPTAEELAALTVVLALLAGEPAQPTVPFLSPAGPLRPRPPGRRPARRPRAQQTPLHPDDPPHPKDPR